MPFLLYLIAFTFYPFDDFLLYIYLINFAFYPFDDFLLYIYWIAFVVYVVIFITMASPTIKETAIVDKIAKNILRVPAISSTTSEIFSSATHSRSAPPK